VVVATGGGTFADAENRAAINLDGVSVWIDLPLNDLIARIPLESRRIAWRKAMFNQFSEAELTELLDITAESITAALASLPTEQPTA